MARTIQTIKDAKGIDIAEIAKAETYDAKVNRNVNLSGCNVNVTKTDVNEKKGEQGYVTAPLQSDTADVLDLLADK
jgi:hypothetical protein